MTCTVRIGLPLPGGALPRAARALGAAVLVSANALTRWSGSGEARTFRSFRHDVPDLDGMDVALDSAGFVAWAHYGAFPWPVDAYVRLAAANPWAWWAQMDACCEPEMAADMAAVRLRQAETIRLLGECDRMARIVGAPQPVPVLQGWTPDDYEWHVCRLDLTGRRLVGVGSMCRRDVFGPDGLLAVVGRLDAVLPPHVRLHLFGVKSEGLALLARHPRVESIDSMAWDMVARYHSGRLGVSCSMALRAECMREWYEAQVAAASEYRPVPGVLPLTMPGLSGPDAEVVEWYADAVILGAMDVRTAEARMRADLAAVARAEPGRGYGPCVPGVGLPLHAWVEAHGYQLAAPDYPVGGL